MIAPASTYRLQLTPELGFAQANALVEYLDALGVGALYTSPIMRAEPGSTHGYDVVDPTNVSPELGGEDAFQQLASTLAAREMGLVVDFVPNHMGVVSHHNTLWHDVLENGPSSRHADTFDIDWSPPKPALSGRILLPILGDAYGVVLERGELTVTREGGVFFLCYGRRRLPLAPRGLAPLVQRAAEALEGAAQDELFSIATALRNLPAREHTEEAHRTERAREKAIAQRRLAALIAEVPAAGQAIDGELERLRGTPGDPASFDALDQLIAAQIYRPSHWRVALESINYRRFFDVNDLAAVRVERPEVFAALHTRLIELVHDRQITGIRLDHTDGLHDPTAYFAQLQAACAVALDRPSGDDRRALWVVAEKILGLDEPIPASWSIHGTTGYDFARLATGVLVDGRSAPWLDAFYRRFTGDHTAYAARVVETKRLVLRTAFASELQVLGRALERIADADRRYRDHTLGAMLGALTELIAHFPVYRTYLRPDGSRQPLDDAHLARALDGARRANPSTSALVYDFLAEVLALVDLAPERVAFVMKFQQLTGPVMAKAVEDTAFYAHTRFIAAHEVGADPAHLAVTVDELHRANAARARDWPLAMTTTSTHDTKRGEDARARLAVISELGDEWRHAVSRWSRLARARKTEVAGAPAPSMRDEYFFYQSLLGALPFDFGGGEAEIAELEHRLGEALVKAAKEAKLHSSWINPSEPYEAACRSFAARMLREPAFLDDVRSLCARIAPAAVSNALAQCTLKLCSPGVPDVYQGAELWLQSLVDPDNRRPVDFERRRALLATVSGPRTDPAALLADYPSGAIKLYVTRQLLQLRRALPAILSGTDYRPIEAGPHLIAFTREARGARILCVVPRLVLTLTGRKSELPIGAVWGERAIEGPSGTWQDVLTGRVHRWSGRAPVAELLATLPVAVLRNEG